MTKTNVVDTTMPPYLKPSTTYNPDLMKGAYEYARIAEQLSKTNVAGYGNVGQKSG